MSKHLTIENITQYISAINRIYKAGNATEHSYRPALKSLLEKIFNSKGINPLVNPIVVTNEPKRIACGAPDYIVTRKEIPIGYIEAKDIDTDLNGKANKEQFDRYRQSLNNLIITDYLTFQLFVNGERVITVTIGKTVKTGIEGNKTQFEAFTTLMHLFVGYDGKGIQTSALLSKVMAAKARLMAKIIEKALNNKEAFNFTENNTLDEQLKGFCEVLIHNITHKEFSDIYAQTVAYGMFAAKFNDTGPAHPLEVQGHGDEVFTRSKAAQLIPHSNPFLRKLFQYIAGYDLDERISWIVDDLADLFNYVDIYAIIKEFDKTDHDPLIHFYETFLAEYDPILRKSRGVWYTPKPVVQFIVQAVDDILKQDFEISEGLADTSYVETLPATSLPQSVHRVQILDPATGTGTFLAEVVRNIYQRFKNQQGMWQSYVSKHLIPRVNGFEILMASYAMAHLNLEMLLQQTGYKPSANERLRIYLTNSLEEARAETKIPFAKWLTDEANEASRIKQNVPVMVVLGNPPYSGESQNSGKWIENLIAQYKKEPQNPTINIPDTKWLNNDYVKFIRFGQYFVKKNGEGVLAFITDNSFLDSLSFRGMRYNLMHTFDKIFILNLHGNSLKKESAPDGSKDENVFDIMQGVSINIFVKERNSNKINPLVKICYYDLYGKREEKYNFLLDNNLKTVEWKELQPQPPNYFFVPKDFSSQQEYEKGFKIDELFLKKSDGIVTSKDAVFINDNIQILVKNIKGYFDINSDENLINKISYRPFDNKYIYYDTKKLERARKEIMQHLINCKNISLIVSNRCESDWRYVFVSKFISEFNLTGTARRLGAGKVFPLYLYPEGDKLFSNEKRKSNLNTTIINELSQRLGLHFTEEKKFHSFGEGVVEDGARVVQESAGVVQEESEDGTFAPIDLFDYIYAVLHNPVYRERYKEFLKIDFPRIPYPENAAQFWQWVALGKKLRCLHLMSDVAPQHGTADFPVSGSNEVEKPQFFVETHCNASLPNGRVYINDTQYLDNVPLEAWNFYIGGYQPAQKWLKDRKGRTLDYEDIRHYQKMILALKTTDEIMRNMRTICADSNTILPNSMINT